MGVGILWVGIFGVGISGVGISGIKNFRVGNLGLQPYPES